MFSQTFLAVALLAAAVVAASTPAPICKTHPHVCTYSAESNNSALLSVSGLSAGGFAAVQFHVAFSSQVAGAGIVAGGPYYCAQDALTTAETECLTIPSVTLSPLLTYTSSQVESGAIDDTSNLTSHNVWLYSGTKDSVVNPGVMQVLEQYYANYVTQGSVATMFNISSEHAMITNDYGNSCATLGSPYINNCGFSAAELLLEHIYGPLATAVDPVPQNVHKLDQSQFVPGGVPSKYSLEDTAYAYVPTGCQGNTTCRVHIALHGCQQTLDTAGFNTTYVINSGYNQVAEANNIIVVYPQAKVSYVFPSNPEGCFDWWGYSGSDYATQSAPQLVTMLNLAQSYLPSSMPSPHDHRQ